MTTQQDEQDVLQCEQRRYTAMMQGDVATVDALLADDLTYAHSGGSLDSKARFMEKLASGHYKFASISSDEVCARVYGVVGLLTGTGQMRVQVQNNLVSFRYRFTIVYRKAQGRWQMVAIQHTRLPEG
jgi:ketosteroid isomerase-like protein